MLPDTFNRRMQTLKEVVDNCIEAHGGIAGEVTPEAGVACSAEIPKANALAATGGLRTGVKSGAALERAYAACVSSDASASPAAVETLAATPAGAACRTLLNPLAGDDAVLRAMAAETIEARGLDDDGHFTLTRAGRTTRAQAVAAVGDVVQPGQSGGDEVIVVASEGAFLPLSYPGPEPPPRSRMLAFIVTADGQVSDLAIRGVPFVAPESVSKVGYGMATTG